MTSGLTNRQRENLESRQRRVVRAKRARGKGPIRDPNLGGERNLPPPRKF